MILTQIIEEKRKEIESSKAAIPESEIAANAEALTGQRQQGSFRSAIAKPGKTHLIAEIKKASPSAGVLREDFDPVKIALAYQMNGASAISVLTDSKFFLGDISYLEIVKKKVSLPLLRKDFIIDEYQVYESVVAGADAALLIASLFSARELRKFIDIGTRLNLDFLVETHSEEDVTKAVDSGCQIIGINNRDLHTFKVDVKTTTRLLKLIPEDRIIVSESGIKSKDDISYLKSLGVGAVLIGEIFMRSEDIGAKVRELLS